ncbi:DDB1- and CUL4-associated factor homolog 1-like [Aristolochia californica]|uniref:DDB1- and CUL4-associated factor homolog 1-like n=1 Tax=Aristolochia californica TaxID=171875 RepID=UPI0035D75845
MDSAMETPPAGESDESKTENEDEALIARAQRLISKIVSTQANPRPKILHALASILEKQEARYLKDSGNSSFNGARGTHCIGRLGNLVRENDDFFELISSKFLSDSRYSTSVHASAARLLLSCSATWMFPHAFEDGVLENIKHWVMNDVVRISGAETNWKLEMGRNKPTDAEMLRTYATGLLSIALAGGGKVVEDVLTSGLSAKLMRYLRTRVLGEASTKHKETSYTVESKYASGAVGVRSREESRSRYRQALESTHVDSQRIGDATLFDDQGAEMDHDRTGVNFRCIDTDASADKVGMYEASEEDREQVGEERWQHGRETRDGKAKYRQNRDEDVEENAREDSSRRRGGRGLGRIRGKGRISESPVDNERDLASPSPGSGLRLGGSGRNIMRERSSSKYTDNRRIHEAKRHSGRAEEDSFGVEREESDDQFKDCKVGTRDISDLVKKATRAAEAEARAANAPAEAIIAAGDAAAELVKSAALEALKNTNDEEAAVLAASNAASTVVEAAIATEISRSSININAESVSCKAEEPEIEEDLEDLSILDEETLGQLRERYCIQSLEILGEYLEVLGPVLLEKGVDVCLALLQQHSKHKEASNNFKMLPEVLKLICALATHRQFAAFFVDRGGMQKLLAVPRESQTYIGLSLCLFTIGSLQGIMERVCALSSDVVYQIIELALQLLECPQDQARKNAAVFFAAAFVFRAVLDSFDAQEGLQKMLNLLHGAASVRSGNNSSSLGGQSNVNTLRNDRSPAEVLTASEKQIAYHTCVALRQYFRAHLLLLVDSLRPNKNHRSVARNASSARSAYKPLDISNEAMEAIFLQIQRDRKLGPAFVRAPWPAVDKFLDSNGHITMLELCQAPTVERYLHDLAQYALGVLHIVTLVFRGRKKILDATLSNDRVGMAVILDAANGAGYVDPEVIQPALNLLVNLVCPPPSISMKPPSTALGQQPGSIQTLNCPASENRERQFERSISDRSTTLPNQNDPTNNAVNAVSTISSGVVGDRRISLGTGAGCAGLAAQLEQGYRQAREAVRANNGIKVLLHLLHPRIFTPPAALDCLRALACRVLLGLARDGTIAHILTKLQVGKKLSELIRDSGSQASGTEQGRWLAELAQVAIELIGIVTNSGRASTLAATDAAAPTLRRIERAAIAAATPITYHSRELLLLIHEHLLASGLATAAAALQKEARLTPLPSVPGLPPLLHQASVQETSSIQLHWPSGRALRGFLSEALKIAPRDENSRVKSDPNHFSVKKKPLVFSSNFSSQVKNQPSCPLSLSNKMSHLSSTSSIPGVGQEAPVSSGFRTMSDTEHSFKTPISLPMKRKLMESKDNGFATPGKRLSTAEQGFQTPVSQMHNSSRRCGQPMESVGFAISPSSIVRDPSGRFSPFVVPDNTDDTQCSSTPLTPAAPRFGFPNDALTGTTERVTLDSLVVQYLKHQHRQCPAPITTLPPLSLLHPHVCPEPSRILAAPTNVTARLSTREFRYRYAGTHGLRKDRQFVYSRFRPWRTCRDDAALLSCICFLGDSSQIATGSHSGELKIFDSNSGNVLESHSCHQSPVILVQSSVSGPTQLVLSSGTYDVRLWDASSVSGGPLHSFDGCKAARFSHSGATFAALSTDSSRREVLLYDIQNVKIDLRLSDSSNPPSGSVRGHVPALIHFSPSDTMLLWNGILWDRRASRPVHRFDQFTDYGGGGFHPAGNEVIINSEVWDLRKFKLLRSVPSLDQTVITFNSSGDVIYAILRRNLEDITSAVQTRRVRHPLFSAFRTVDAVNYSDIATIPVDRCVLDFATEPTDSFVGLVAMDDHEQMFSSARLYEIGRRRPTDDDSDPDDGAETDEEDDDDDSEAEEDLNLVGDIDADDDSEGDDLMSNDGDESIDGFDEEDDGDFQMGFEDPADILEIVTDGEEDDDDSQVVDSFSSDEEEGDFGGNGFTF